MRAAIYIPLATLAGLVFVWVAAPTWSYNVLLSLDQHINTIFGGDPDETMSSRFGKWERDGDALRRHIATQICRGLDIWMWERDHCRKSIDLATGGKAVLK